MILFIYEVFSIYKARYDEGYIRTEFEDYTQFCEFVSNIWGKSMWSREGMQIGYGDRILTLSTCNYHTEDGRLVVVAREVPKTDEKKTK